MYATSVHSVTLSLHLLCGLPRHHRSSIMPSKKAFISTQSTFVHSFVISLHLLCSIPLLCCPSTMSSQMASISLHSTFYPLIYVITPSSLWSSSFNYPLHRALKCGFAGDLFSLSYFPTAVLYLYWRRPRLLLNM